MMDREKESRRGSPEQGLDSPRTSELEHALVNARAREDLVRSDARSSDSERTAAKAERKALEFQSMLADPHIREGLKEAGYNPDELGVVRQTRSRERAADLGREVSDRAEPKPDVTVSQLVAQRSQLREQLDSGRPDEPSREQTLMRSPGVRSAQRDVQASSDKLLENYRAVEALQGSVTARVANMVGVGPLARANADLTQATADYDRADKNFQNQRTWMQSQEADNYWKNWVRMSGSERQNQLLDRVEQLDSKIQQQVAAQRERGGDRANELRQEMSRETGRDRDRDDRGR